jgi:hypothetical protein
LLAFFTTLASFFIVGGIVIAPYAILYFLGKRIAGDGSLLAFRVAGLVVSCGVTVASAVLYKAALDTLSHSTSSTAGLVLLVVPVLLALVGGSAYGLVVFLHSLCKKSNASA